ncbi:MAG: glutathione S-transferase family protein [Alphaproteobacteria bacterium]
MKLYNSNLSPFTARVRIVADLKGMPLEVVSPPTDGSYATITPTAKVPCLDTGTMRLAESETICEYLEDLAAAEGKGPSLLGDTPEERARTRMVARIGDVYVMAPLARLFAQLNPANRVEAVAADASADLATGLAYLESVIGEDGYAVHGRMTMADASLMPVLFFLKAIGPLLGDPMTKAPRASAYYEAITRHPPMQKAQGELAEALKAYQEAQRA